MSFGIIFNLQYQNSHDEDGGKPNEHEIEEDLTSSSSHRAAEFNKLADEFHHQDEFNAAYYRYTNSHTTKQSRLSLPYEKSPPNHMYSVAIPLEYLSVLVLLE